jgi:hypothetical protein
VRTSLRLQDIQENGLDDLEPGLQVCALHFVPRKKYQAQHVLQFGCLTQGARLHRAFMKSSSQTFPLDVEIRLSSVTSEEALHDHTYSKVSFI